ncbi:hypothetical protein CJ738_35260, partial [Klebsiella pneumoniae]
TQIKFLGVHKTDPLLKPGSKWRHDVPIEPSWILYRNALIYMGWLLSKTDYTSKDEFVCHDAIFSPNGSEQRCSICPRTNCRY